ncbi:uncharacterized protein LOC108425700 [Pygocentrus nattereri]|uniref:uncharacterized protein LOC108425700 n=1 Tax=Pygocentrus nattereri TaxID=42514 RepID=UPI000814A34B|nr:uncharacterized protein LOC108425700 [Pygocentrus nattereri]
MEEADRLVELLFRWQKKQEACADKLLDIAKELESIQCTSNTVQIVGNATAVVGFAAAAVATFLTAGLAAPIAIGGAIGSVGTAVSFSSIAIETIASSLNMKDAQKIIKEVEEIGEEIQGLLIKLNDQCARHVLGAHSSAESFDNEQSEVISQVMGALARRNRIDMPLDLLRSFNKAIFSHQQTLDEHRLHVTSSWMSGALTTFLFFTLQSALKVSAKKGVKDLGVIGLKTFMKRSALVVGSSLAVILSIFDLVKNFKKIGSNYVTNASQSLRDAARKMKEDKKTLKEKLDALLDIIKKLLHLKKCIQNLGDYSLDMSEDEEEIVNYIQATCDDPIIISWLNTRVHKTDLLNFLRYVKKNLDKEIRQRNRRDIHIVFVSHGWINNRFVPAASLVQANINDTVLYSPWNCLIDANAAYGIAQGCIRLQQRRLYFRWREPNTHHYPLPQHWNSMRRSTHYIPQILLGPVGEEEQIWNAFHEIGGSLQSCDRIIIPYLVPENLQKHFSVLHFQTVISVLSLVLVTTQTRATVHLAACLGRNKTPWMEEEWNRQYAYTLDETYMTINLDEDVDPSLFQAFKLMFGIQGGQR